MSGRSCSIEFQGRRYYGWPQSLQKLNQRSIQQILALHRSIVEGKHGKMLLPLLPLRRWNCGETLSSLHLRKRVRINPEEMHCLQSFRHLVDMSCILDNALPPSISQLTGLKSLCITWMFGADSGTFPSPRKKRTGPGKIAPSVLSIIDITQHLSTRRWNTPFCRGPPLVVQGSEGKNQTL